MTDLQKLKKMFYFHDASLLIMKNNNIIYKSTNKGITSLYQLYINDIDKLDGSYIADKIIGKAGALILVSAKILGIYAHIITYEAYNILLYNNVKVTYGTKVPCIINRDGSDLCPIEKLATECNATAEIIPMIKEFLKISEK